MGAWIEICKGSADTALFYVAPLVGAWIEICRKRSSRMNLRESLPSWERGLKSAMNNAMKEAANVAPLVGAWIEILLTGFLILFRIRRSPRGSVD